MMINNLKLLLPKYSEEWRNHLGNWRKTCLAIDVTIQMPICPKLNKKNKAKQIVHTKINYLKEYFSKY